MKQDIYGHEQRFKNWKEHVSKNGEDSLTPKNSKLLLDYVFDMEVGNNVSHKSKKGARSFHRLNAVRQKLSRVFRFLQQRNINDVSKLTDKEIQALFDDMRKGVLKTEKGTKYKATADYVKGFKAFWHWWMKVNAREGKAIQDITEYLDSSREEKPVWVYLDETQIKNLFKKVSSRYSTFLEFLYCSGARVTESLSLRVRDVEEKNGVVYVNISEEIAKSSGRKIKLLLSGKNVMAYIKENNLKEDDLLFQLSAPYINRYLGELAKETFGEGISKGGEKYSKLTMYDFRHNSCCYWIQRYKTNSALMYKFGWKSEKYIHYYSEFLGMKDTIREEDLYVDITKTELEREIEMLKKDQKFMKELISQILTNDDTLKKLDQTDFNSKMLELKSNMEGVIQ